MEQKMTIAVRVDQGGGPAKLPSDAAGRTRRTFHGVADRSERSDSVAVTELPVWCIEA
jgi:hypothetical protein